MPPQPNAASSSLRASKVPAADTRAPRLFLTLPPPLLPSCPDPSNADDDNITTTCDEMTNGAKTYPYTVTSNCEKTLGEEADPLYGICQVIFGLLYTFFFVVFAHRFYLSMEVKDTYHRKLNGLSTFACGFLIMGVIDANGYRDILPFQVYFISDEIAAATLLCAGILMIDSIVR